MFPGICGVPSGPIAYRLDFTRDNHLTSNTLRVGLQKKKRKRKGKLSMEEIEFFYFAKEGNEVTLLIDAISSGKQQSS